MESPQALSPSVQTPSTTKTKAGKLKTYAKQRAASATKPSRSSARIRMASEELNEPPASAPPVIPATIDETPVKTKATKKSKKKRASETAASPDQVMADAPLATPEEQPAKTRKRRSKKKSFQDAEIEVPETQEEPLRVEDEARLEEAQQQEVEIAESEPEVEAAAGAEEAEGEVDMTEADASQFDVPPDSDNEEGASRPSSSKPKATKRKRQTSENESPVPIVKRQKKASIPRSSTLADYPEQGPFTAIEAEMIENHLTEFCQRTGINRDELVAKIQESSREMSKIYVELANEILPHRNRRAVQRYCRRHYNNFQRGRWTDEQDDMLRAAYAENPNKWVNIGARVGRMPEDCRDRWRNHVSLDSRHTDVWTQDEEHRLATAVRECLLAVEEKLDVSLNRDNEDDYIAWPVVVGKMNGSRNRLQCSMKWRKIKARVAREEAAQREREEKIARGEEPPEELDDDDGMTSPHTGTRWKAEARRRYDEMTMGDMLDITKETLYGAQMGAFASKNTFWAVVTRLHGGSPWTTADRKLVYKRLKANIADTGNFKKNLEEQLAWIESSFDQDALAERSQQQRQRHSSTGGRRSAGGAGLFRSEERVQESDDEDNAVGQQLLMETNGHGHGIGNGFGGDGVAEEEDLARSPHVSESEPEMEED